MVNLIGSSSLTFVTIAPVQATANGSGSTQISFTGSGSAGNMLASASLSFVLAAGPTAGVSSIGGFAFVNSATIQAVGSMIGASPLVFAPLLAKSITLGINGTTTVAFAPLLAKSITLDIIGTTNLALTTSMLAPTYVELSANANVLTFSSSVQGSLEVTISGTAELLFVPHAEGGRYMPIDGTTSITFNQFPFLDGLLPVAANTDLVWSGSSQAIAKNAIFGQSAQGFALTGVISEGIGSPVTMPMSFSATANIGFKSALSGWAHVVTSSTANGRLATGGNSSLGITPTGYIQGIAPISSSIALGFTSNPTLMAKVQISGTTTAQFVSTADLLEFDFNTVLGGFDPVTNSNPQLYLYIPHTPYSLMLIQTYDRITRCESVFAAILDKQTQEWDRLHLWTGSPDFPNSVQFTGAFDGEDFFCSIQTSNVYQVPQLVRNQTFILRINSGKLSSSIQPFFDRTFALPSEFWKAPSPTIVDLNGKKMALWLSMDTHLFELFEFDGTWNIISKTLNGAPLYIQDYKSFFSIDDQMLGILGNNGITYVSSNGYTWTS